MKLTPEQYHFLNLVSKATVFDERNYAMVNKNVVIAYKDVEIPSELCYYYLLEDRTGRAKLTEAGKVVLQWDKP